MPAAPSAASPSGTLWFAVVLAAVAGFLDAHIFQHVTPVFVANHSGNLIKLGMDLGDRRWNEAGISLCAIVAFALGVAVATLFVRRGGSGDARERVALLLAAEVALLVLVFGLIAAFDIEGTLDPRADDYLVVVIAACAMGFQTAALGRVGTTAVSTTYGSGSVARIGEHAALGTFRPAGDDRSLHLGAARVLLAVVTAYVLGATLASALADRSMAIGLPVVAVAGLAAVDITALRRR